jgi:subtilisin family serine protease
MFREPKAAGRRWRVAALALVVGGWASAPLGGRAAPPESLGAPLSPDHPWVDLRDRLLREIDVEDDPDLLDDAKVNPTHSAVPSLREQAALDYQAALAAKERCDEEGREEAERLIERMRQARDFVAPLLGDADRLVAATAVPGFFRDYSRVAAGLLTHQAQQIRDAFAEALDAIDQQIADAEAYDPCRRADDASPEGDPVDAGPALELGQKARDQLELGSSTGRSIPGGSVRLVELPDPAAEEGPERADAGPDDQTQQETDVVLMGGVYVVQAPCHEEQVVTGDRLWAGDVQLEPKQRPLVLWVPIYIPREPGATLGPLREEILAKAREVLEERAGENLDDYDVDVEPAETPLEPLGVWLHKVVLTPKRPPCPDALTDAPVLADGLQSGDTSGRPPDPGGSGAFHSAPEGPVSGDPPPPADDDPSVDPVTPVAPEEGTIERTVPREDKRPHPDDPLFRADGSWGQPYPDQWGLRRIGFDPASAASLWPETGQPVVVAVIDTGVDRFHPELRDAIWVNEGEVPGNGLDDDGNGYVDDVHGWNFADGSADTLDINGHGTVTAGIIAAATGNGAGIAGVNPWARIMPVRITTWSGRSTNLRIADAIRYAVDNGARVINLSYGGRERTWSEYLAVADARSRGVIVVAAAGNDGADAADESPAGLPGVITVAATDTDDERLGFSNWGAGVDVAAPGLDVLSLRARHTDLLRFKRDDYAPGAVIVGEDRRYYRLTGTSFSAPFVSGVASLILSTRPELSDEQVMRMLLHSARDVGTPGWDQYTGYGRLDARAALRADPDFFVVARLSGVAVRQVAGEPVVEVSGRALADRFSRAWVEIGRGEEPGEWQKASEELTRPVDRGVVAEIPAARLRGAARWTLRLVVEHASGARREARFDLTLG